MEAGVFLFAVRDATNYMEQNNLLHADGSFGDFSNVATDVGLAAAIEASLKEHGVSEPDKVDKVIKALPGIISLINWNG